MPPFLDSSAIAEDGAALAARMDSDGYLLLRRVLPAATVEALRKQVVHIYQ